MAKTLKLNVSFPMTVIVSTEALAELTKDREEARQIHAEKLAELTGERKFLIEMFRGEKSNEELLELIYRADIREFITKDMRNEIAGGEVRIRLGSVKVAFEGRKEVCTCGPKAGCSKCPGKRWMETV